MRALWSDQRKYEIWLEIDVKVFAERVTDGQLETLVRCGVRYDDDVDSLCMFV